MKTTDDTTERELRYQQMETIVIEVGAHGIVRLREIDPESGLIVLAVTKGSIAASSTFGKDLPGMLRECADLLEMLRTKKNGPFA